jgi:alpha-tubulin suppressor-like RCC1 family protein
MLGLAALACACGELLGGSDDVPPLPPDAGCDGCVDGGPIDGRIAQVAAGGVFACARLQSGELYCWGNNRLGEVASGPAGDDTCIAAGASSLCRPNPSRVGDFTDVAFVAAGFAHACLVRRDGSVYCWGINDSLQLGHSNAGDENSGGLAFSRVPTKVEGLDPVAELALGRYVTCALTRAGAVKCWGANWYGQLGAGTTTAAIATPTAAAKPLDTEVVQIALAAFDSGHACARRGDGTVWCWGPNPSGEVGVESTTSSMCPDVSGSGDLVACVPTPVQVLNQGGAPLVNVTSVAALLRASCVGRPGSVWCWGENTAGLTGVGPTYASNPSSTLPHQLALTPLGDVAGQRDHACAIGIDRAPWCWGRNHRAQLGLGDLSADDAGVCTLPPCFSAPTRAIGGLRALSIAASVNATFLVTLEGDLYGWGSNVGAQMRHLPTTQEEQACPGAACVLVPTKLTPIP